MKHVELDWKNYSTLARTAAAEGCVLLRNENQTLPLRTGDTVAVFGRTQFEYYKSGTGSGGMVNVPYVHSILDGLKQYPKIRLYQPLLNTYRTWLASHPFDKGNGWGTEPWAQAEMEPAPALIEEAASHTDAALIVIGRTAGEDRDNTPLPGSYYLTDIEKHLIESVCAHFTRTAVILNVGNIIDMSWVEEYKPQAVLYAWQGGMEGGFGVADVLCGAISPSGSLTDTIARTLSDYPCHANFGSETENLYQEDIYVGYRYFETFAKGLVLYPFGYGLSYTSFQTSALLTETEHSITLTAIVKNIGPCAGKETVQVYVSAPQGKLGKPLRVLCAYAKTAVLAPEETETLTMVITKNDLASYDDSGNTGEKSCYVLEPGEYRLYTGRDVRSASYTGSFMVNELTVTRRLEEVMAPVKAFERLVPCSPAFTAAYEPAPLRKTDPASRRTSRLPSALPYTGDQGYKLVDVKEKKVSLQQFLSQIPDQELMYLVHGEGMCSPKVTPGTAAAFGGITEKLQSFGIPAACCADGPSGIRMDCGTSAFSLPNGTLLACTFNLPLVEALFEMEGMELRSNQIDALLGPGINLHRSPLNGRNFEYHSEDPYLTGTMAAAETKGMDRYGVTGTLKHFCANNQEYCRHTANAVVSERALRELYLKPYELCVRAGHVHAIMTSYGPVNGIWTAGNYDLNTTVLRHEWGFTGIVMTDWWAKANVEGDDPSTQNLAAMIRAQNDLYMVTGDAMQYEDNLSASLSDGTLTRAELLRSAENICRFLLHTPAMERLTGDFEPVALRNQPENLTISSHEALDYITVTNNTVIPLTDIITTAGTSHLLALSFEAEGDYLFSLTASSAEPANTQTTPADKESLAQMSVTLSMDGTVLNTFSYHGTLMTPETQARKKEVRGTTHYLNFFFAQSGLKLHALQIQRL